MNTFAATLGLLLLTATADAQFVGPGLRWAGSSGNGTGSFVPSCSNLPVTAVPGETVTVSVWGDFAAPFALFAAGSGSQCLPVAGLGNALVLDQPVVTVLFGMLGLVSPCLSCPPAFADVQFTVPAGLPAGTALTLQAASFGAQRPAFTVAITGTL